MKLFCSECYQPFEAVLPLTNILMTEIASPCCGSNVLKAGQAQAILENHEHRKADLIAYHVQQMAEEFNRFRIECERFEDAVVKNIKAFESKEVK